MVSINWPYWSNCDNLLIFCTKFEIHLTSNKSGKYANWNNHVLNKSSWVFSFCFIQNIITPNLYLLTVWPTSCDLLGMAYGLWSRTPYFFKVFVSEVAHGCIMSDEKLLSVVYGHRKCANVQTEFIMAMVFLYIGMCLVYTISIY